MHEIQERAHILGHNNYIDSQYVIQSCAVRYVSSPFDKNAVMRSVCVRKRELELLLISDKSTQGSYEKQQSKRKKARGEVSVQDGF